MSEELKTSRSFDYNSENSIKADLSHIYNQPTPHEYFSTLIELEYGIAHRAAPYFHIILDWLQEGKSNTSPQHVFDMGCSYGVLSAALKHDLLFSDLAEHYASDPHTGSVESSLERDLVHIGTREVTRPFQMTGIDIADNAVRYALSVGLLDNGIVRDPEIGLLHEATILRNVDLITSTGCIGYVGERGVANLLDSISGPPPIVAFFVLRMFDYDPIARILHTRRYKTFHLDQISLPQRAFMSPEEASATIDLLTAAGKDIRDKEATGYYFADLHLAVPEDLPAAEVVSRILRN